MILPPLILIPGAWMGSWVWDRVVAELSSERVASHALTLTGLESEDSGSDADLETHIEDVRRFVVSLRTRRVSVVGHSYSGLVAGCFAARFPDLVPSVMMVEAFLPVDGECLLDTAGLDKKNELRFVDGKLLRWPPPTLEELSTQPGLDKASCHWLAERFVGHPSPSIIQPAAFPASIVRGAFIGGSPPNAGEGGSSFDLDYYPIKGGHWPMVSQPEQLANLLIRAVRPV
jgi:pimeloyl-ACP methyl ester carboxylesterase